jgi:hypothetical protein
MQLLVINPNTSAEVTRALQQQVQTQLEALASARPFTLHAVTARLGARYIASETSYALAAHGALDAYALHEQQAGAPDAVLLGCFGDPGVWALRELSRRPVVGLAEAALREAAALGPFAIVTGGCGCSPWRPAAANWRRSPTQPASCCAKPATRPHRTRASVPSCSVVQRSAAGRRRWVPACACR